MTNRCSPWTPRQAVNASRGFTLVEMMVTVLIIGTLAAIAWPQYTQYIKQSRRADVKASLMAASQHMQRLLDANNGSYQVNNEPPKLPSDLITSPPNSSDAKVMYTIAVATPTPNSFLLTATRSGAMANDECGDYTLDQRGRMNVNSASKTLQECTH